MALEKVIGPYIINESAIMGFENTNIISETKDGRLIGEGVLQTADVKNRNQRIYPKEELFPQLKAPRTLELLEAGYLRAELGHPLSNELVRQQTIDDSRTCAQFLKLWTEGDNVWGRFRGTNNAFGASFDADLRDGCKPAWSLRALGTLVQTPRGAEVKKLRVITWDQVIYPSHPNAYMTKLLSETTNVLGDKEMQSTMESMVIPITNEKVIDFIKSSSKNIKFVQECFDFVYDRVEVDRNKSNVVLTTKEGDIMVVNLENYIHNELMNYADEYKNKFTID